MNRAAFFPLSRAAYLLHITSIFIETIKHNSNMKRIYRPLIKGTNWALAGLLSLLTGTSCDKIINGGGVVEYGMPYTEYNIKGKVVNEAGSAIPGIEVKAGASYDKDFFNLPEYPYKTATGTDGGYEFTFSTGFPEDFTVYATDTDGETNGAYQPDSAAVKGSEIKLTGGSGTWYKGKGEATVDFTLKEETAKEEE